MNNKIQLPIPLVFSMLMVFTLSLIGVSPIHLSQATDAILHPNLRALADHASLFSFDKVDVIVQKQAGVAHNLVEAALLKQGGRVTLDLSIINGFAAVVPVRALRSLAIIPGVKWVSPDGEIKLSTSDGEDNAKAQYKTYLPLTLRQQASLSSSPTANPTATPTGTRSGLVVQFTPGVLATATPTPTEASGGAVPLTNTPTATATSSSTATSLPPSTATPTPTPIVPTNLSFYRAVNLGGPALTIDGRSWEGETASGLSWSSEKYAQPEIVIPNISPEMATMLRSGVRDVKGNTRVKLQNVPYGVYDITLYSWDYAAPQSFNVYIEGRLAQADVRNSAAGAWRKLGPYRVLVMDSELSINTSGGYANLSGVEMWKVDLAQDPSPAASCFALPRTRWQASSSYISTLPTINAIDADLRTRWSVDTQREDMWFQVDLGESYSFDTIEFDSGKYFARNFKIQSAEIDANWSRQPIIASGQGGGITTISTTPRNMRYIRITLTGSLPEASWGIYDFGVFDCAALQTTARGQNVFNDAIGVTRLRQESPLLQGQGIGVAILDSGVNDTSDLNTTIGTNRVLVSVRLNDDLNQTPDDGYGHGNHIAGIIGGNGSASSGNFIGVAPGVNLINVKVSNDDGSARASRIVAGMQWILQNRDRYNIRVVNISLNNAVYESYLSSPLAAAAEILWFNKIVVVVSAGNKGSGNLFPPANDPFVITVGAVDDKGTADLADDIIPTFSAYGVTAEGFAKPDLVAPGVNIVGLRANQNSRLSQLHPDHNVVDGYFRMSGTSMSAPMVAGAVALLLQQEPNLTPDQVKFRLKSTARRFGNPTQTGAGYLDLYAALRTSTNESANTGLTASTMLTSGNEPVNGSVSWNSVSWNSVSWNSVSWNSVSWNSVSWNSVSWSSDHWDAP